MDDKFKLFIDAVPFSTGLLKKATVSLPALKLWISDAAL